LDFIEKSTTFFRPFSKRPRSRSEKQQQEISIFFLNYTQTRLPPNTNTIATDDVTTQKAVA
jgi:hypothetical protein